MYGTQGMVHGTRVKVMVRLHNYGTVWQRCLAVIFFINIYSCPLELNICNIV